MKDLNRPADMMTAMKIAFGGILICSSIAVRAQTTLPTQRAGNFTTIYIKGTNPGPYRVISLSGPTNVSDKFIGMGQQTSDPNFKVYNPGDGTTGNAEWVQFYSYPGGQINYMRTNCTYISKTPTLKGDYIDCHFTLNACANCQNGDGLVIERVLVMDPTGKGIWVSFNHTNPGSVPVFHIDPG